MMYAGGSMSVGRSLLFFCLLGGCHLVAPIPDLTSGTSGASDGGVPSEGGSVSPCNRDPAPTFCDDFDVAALGERWTEPNVRDATLELDPAISVSPPKSLHAVAPANSNDFASLRKSLGEGRALSIELDILIDKLVETSFIEPLRITVKGSGIDQTDISLHVTASRASTLEFFIVKQLGPPPPPPDAVELSQRIPIGKWTHVRLELAFETSRMPIKMLLDGTNVADKAVNASVPPGTIDVFVGAVSSSTFEEPAEIHVDSVVVDVTR
jgi:hypothetical protein